MTPDHQDPERTASAHLAPRCQHTLMTGVRCGSPALHGEKFCYFHNRVHDPRLDWEPYLPLIEDASSLQLALARVMKILQVGHIEYKRVALMLYALQIACSNMKNFVAERSLPQSAEDEQLLLIAADSEHKRLA